MNKLALSIPHFGKIDDPSSLPTGIPTGNVAGSGTNIISALLNTLFIVAILLAILWIIRGSLNMITSGGEKQRFQLGRERIRYAIIGLLVIFFAFAIINIISAFVGVNLLSFDIN